MTGFTLVDARGGAPDPDLGPIEDGATLDLSGIAGRVNVRAEMVASAARYVGSVHFELRGPYSMSRRERGSPYTLVGDRRGDYFERELFDGAYTLTATPYSPHAHYYRPRRPRSVSFTVTGARAADVSPVTGFALVDARGGAPDRTSGRSRTAPRWT